LLELSNFVSPPPKVGVYPKEIILAATCAYATLPEADHDKQAQAQVHAANHAKERRPPDPKRHKIRQLARVGFTVQSGEYADIHMVKKIIAALKDDGRDAFYYRGKAGGYVVHIGDFATRRAATVAGNRLKASKVIARYTIVRPSATTVAQQGRRVARTGESISRQATYLERPSGKAAPKPSKRWWETKPAGEVAPAFSNHSGGAAAATEPGVSDIGVVAARTAERFVGIPYLWGGNTVVDGLDCSGFVRAVYNLCGYALPRVARDQYRLGEAVTLGQIREGDLIFFGPSPDNIKHVGMYVGGGQFVHAPKRGDLIRITPITDAGYAPRIMGIRRFF
jgi:gamma-D-glutamyl-L-lysine dipeptidyl-peptidase